MATLHDEGQAWRRVRSAMARDALADEAWVSRYLARPETGEDLEQLLEGFPITIPRDLGTESSRQWAERLRQDSLYARGEHAQTTPALASTGPGSVSGPAVPTLALETANLIWSKPWATGAVVAALAAVPSFVPYLGRGWPLAGMASIALLVAIALVATLYTLVSKQVLKRGPLPQLAVACLLSAAVLAVASTVSAGLLLLGSALCALLWLYERPKTSPAVTKRGGDATSHWGPNRSVLDEVDESVLGLLRARASLYGVDCIPVEDLDRVAVVVGYDLWMFSLKAQSIDQAPWFGPASMEAVAALVARAAGHGRRSGSLPGVPADAKDFPGIGRRTELWQAWIERAAGVENVPEVMARVASDLQGSYSDRVSRVSRLFTGTT